MESQGTRFIRTLASRLESILPNRTGHTLAEVELNSQFIITTNLILKNCKPNELNGHQDFFSELLSALVAILEKLNLAADSGKLIMRNENVLASTVILTRLLRIIAITNWDPERNYTHREGLSLDFGIKFDIGSSNIRDNFELYAHTEPPAVHADLCHVLEVLFTLLSPEVNVQALADIRKFKPTSRDIDYCVSPQVQLLPEELRAQILEIDSNTLVVLRYIAASNQADYATFLKRKLFSYVERGEHVPLAALQRYASLLMYVYCTPNNTSFYLKLVYNSIPYVRSNTWKQLLLHYESMNLRTQCINKPGFYSKVIYAGSTAEQECKVIFDYIFAAFEHEPNANTSLFLWYVILCPSDFEELLLKSNKIKQVFNKRVKFLNSVLKDSQAGVNLDCFESLISIFLLGSLLPETESGVRQFSIRFLDETYHLLVKMRSKCVTDSLLVRYRVLYQKLFTAAIVIKPEKYIPLFIREFQQKHESQSEIFYDLSKILDSHDLLSVVMALSCLPRYRNMFDAIMKRINGNLSNIMHACTQILFQSERPVGASRRLSNDSQSKAFSYMTESHNEANSNPHYWLKPCRSQVSEKHTELVEDILRITLDIYTEGPSYFLQFNFVKPDDTEDRKVEQMLTFSNQVFAPLSMAIYFRATGTRSLFGSACKLSMKLLQVGNAKTSSDETHCICTFISHNVIHSTCEVISELSYPAFKEYFVFLKTFMLERIDNIARARENAYYQSKWVHTGCERVCTSLDKLLMLCLCTHDIQFFSLLKLSIKAHAFEALATENGIHCYHNSLAESFSDVMGDDVVFTGFVSLHKKFKSILADFEPTKGLYEAWVIIYGRWMEMIDNMTGLDDDTFTFKHYTEFLSTTSGCFLRGKISETRIGDQEAAKDLISSFYDRAVSLLDCEELFIRVVIREALSAETHPDVYRLIYDKIMDVIRKNREQKSISSQSILFTEEAVSIFSSILSMKSEGALVLAALFPDVVEIFFDYVSMVPRLPDQIKLKLRLCKLTSVIAIQKEQIGVSGAFKLRNLFAKTVAEWLESAVFYNIDESTNSINTVPVGGRASDIEYLQIELATECSKCLALQLQSLVLTVPDGTKEKNFDQAKDLVFSNFFSLFYKLFQKFNGSDPSPLMIKSKYKIQNITDQILKGISNMLQSNIGIGLQFALPLGYHENQKIRPIFLDIFATTLSAGKLKSKQEDISDEKIHRLAELYEIYGAAAAIASPAEHNLLATSLNGLYGYTMGLDKLFLTLLKVEMKKVNRASDIFRGNSTLTRLMSIFAKEYGTPYLSVVLRPFVEDMVENSVVFEVERESEADDVKLFIKYLKKLVDSVVNSMPWVPEPFRFICVEIFKCVGEKFEDASLIAVGSFLFLRFFCPAIVSPESFFDLTSVDQKVKRSLMQIVKTIQYMANGSILNLRWKSLMNESEVMNKLSEDIFRFLGKIATESNDSSYVFHRITLKPLTCLRYIHKFFFTYFVEIRHNFLVGDSLSDHKLLQQKIATWRKLDSIMAELGNPKPSISLQGTRSYKAIDSQSNLGNSQFAEFMAKMSAKNIETSIEAPIVRNAVFHDGIPAVVITFRHLREISFDVGTLVYLVLENVSPIWENPFYCVVDLTQFYYLGIVGKNFASLLNIYAPKIFFANCKRTFYYNLPRASHLSIIESLTDFRPQNRIESSISFYSEQDDREVIETLCLSESTMAIPLEVKFVCNSCTLYEEDTHLFTNVTVKLGRLWLLLWFDRFDFHREYTATESVAPVEVLRLSDLARCETSNKSGKENEFTLYLNRYNYQVTLISPQRQEILRFLYLAMLRSSKKSKDLRSVADELELEESQRFSAIAHLLFHGLLQNSEEIRISASNLLRSFSSYYEITFDDSSKNFTKASFPIDMTDFVVSYSSNLADNFPQYSYEFLKAFFANFDSFALNSKISGIMYISPWVVNLHEHISKDLDGIEKISFVVRQLCKLTTRNPDILPFTKELVWKRIFRDMRMTAILVEELVAIAMEIASESDDWNVVISVFYPSVELCGELVSRLHDCISKTKNLDSEIAIQSKILEISLLVKICASVFFDSYVFGSLYLLDVFFFCTLFIDRSDLEFGHDLQSLVLNTVQSFARKPLLDEGQMKLIGETAAYFSGQRAKMLFGLTTKERGAHVDFSQNYERSISFEHLCDYLNNFISNIGSSDDKKYWVSRWSSLSKDIAFSDSFFQMRAYTIVCTLARSGVSDSVGGRIMEVLTSQFFDNPDSYFEGSVCFLRLMRGLAKDSVFLPLLVWVVVGAILLDFPLNYQAIISSLSECLNKMISEEGFAKNVFAFRSNLDPLLEDFERRVGVSINENNYEFVILFLISKGLAASQTRHTSVMTIKRALVRKRESIGNDFLNQTKKGDFTLAYLLVLYLSLLDSAFQEFMREIHLEETPMTQIGRDKIPQVLLEGLCQLSRQLQLALIIAARLFSGDCELIFKYKFIALYAKVFELLKDTGLLVLHLVQEKLEDSFISAASNSHTNDISALLMEVVRDTRYNSKSWQEKVDTILREDHISSIDFVNTHVQHHETNESVYRMTLVRQIFYRNLCSAIDGLKLERY